MDKKIKTALVATAAAFTAFSVHQVSADEASDKTANKETTEVETLKPVSDQQIADAEKKVLDTKAAIKQKEANLTQAEADAKVAAEKEKAAAEKAKEATPEAIQKAKDNATTAAEAVKTAEADVKTKKATQDALAKDVATKQTEADYANSAVDAAAKKVQDLENGTPSLTAAEKAKTDAEKAKTDAEKAKTDAEKAKESAKKADAAADKKVTDLNNELTAKKQTLADKEKALKDLGEKPQGFDFSDVKFNLGSDFAAALNERAKLMGENDPNNTGDGRANELSTRNQAEVTANAEKLKQLAKTNMAKNTYTNTTDTREVDIWNLTADQKREINLFGLHIVNQIREQLGNPKVKTTVGMEKFANEAADTRNKKYAKIKETYAKPDYDGINAAAKANGLSYKTGDNQNQSDIIYANAKTFEKTTESEVFKSEQNLNTLIQNSTRRPTMTMGQLKEYIFEAYNNKMFTNNEDYTGANSHRAWENALSIGGSIAYRKDGEGNKLGRKASEYNATSVTASVKFNPQPYKNKWGDYRYFTNLEIFVHNFQTAGENKEPGQDTNSIVLDPTKFNATEIKNDPTAAKEYSAKKQAAEKAVKDAQAEVNTAQSNLDTAKQYKNQLPAAENALTDATSKLTAAEKALQEAETNLNNLRQGLTNKAEELNKAKAALETAKQEAVKATTALTEAKAKLAQAEKDVKDSEANVKTKDVEKAKAEELVTSLENAKQIYEKAKAEKAASDAKVAELHKCVADKQTELVKLEEEYKDLLKRRISNLIQPENPELTFSEEVKEEEIKFNIVEELDPSLKEGERVVKTPGVVGRKKTKATIFKADGKEVGRVVDNEEVLTKAIDEVVLVGTKKEVSPILPEYLPPRKDDKKPEVNKPEVNKPEANKPEVKPDREKTLPREEVNDEKQDSKPAVSDDAKKVAEQAISNSKVTYMAPKATQSVVYVENAKKLPTTGMKDSKASIVLAIIAATSSLGLVAIKKEEK
ncbi:SEC10/PgrA surface exclusion domain-containing protein [Streptococcus mitis]|uniref:Chromosome partition protein Smc n=1 Tax=Streptococcus mitis TaxID=28037 RepID=A0A0F2DF97_STRMT|nr:SEC10/PgrA surface exclusion domain-containing protein [Streptococcus mitis]KJQ69702.1 Chromosome partition protein Smc [Streptococcus mitis]